VALNSSEKGSLFVICKGRKGRGKGSYKAGEKMESLEKGSGIINYVGKGGGTLARRMKG